MELKELKATEFAEIRKLLIKKKGDDLQRDFLEAARGKDTFVSWISERIPYNNTNLNEVDLLPRELSENEFKNTTRDVEKIAFDTWNSITPSMACRSSFWGAVTLNHLRHGLVKPTYLAVENISSQTGLSRIEKALRSNDSKLTDDVTRTILRRFSGLPEARGGLRSIYVNCAFGRAWWREKITREVVDFTGGDEEAISQTLRTSQEYWERLINMLSTSNSVFGDEKIRTSFIWALSDHVDNPKYSKLFKSKGAIDKCMDVLGIYSACQEFGVYEQGELKTFMQKDVIEPVLFS